MPKTTIEEVARAALGDDGLEQQMVLLAFVHDEPALARVERPAGDDEVILAASASILELLAEHTQQQVPSWTAEVGAVGTPVYLGMGDMVRNPRWVEMAHRDAPNALRKRNLYSMAEYLTFA
jgi:hypothetical protein